MTMETPFCATSGWLTLPIGRLASRVWKAGGVTVARLTEPGSEGWTLPSAVFSASGYRRRNSRCGWLGPVSR